MSLKRTINMMDDESTQPEYSPPDAVQRAPPPPRRYRIRRDPQRGEQNMRARAEEAEIALKEEYMGDYESSHGPYLTPQGENSYLTDEEKSQLDNQLDYCYMIHKKLQVLTNKSLSYKPLKE